MESVMKDIKSTTQKKYTDYSKSPGSPDNDFLFMYSVARWVWFFFNFKFIANGITEQVFFLSVSKL